MCTRTLAALLLAALALAGCQPAAAPSAPPTLADLSALATSDAATAAALATPTRTPLPPTWTPLPGPTETATPTPPPTAPAGFRAQGTIYYIFEGKTVIELAPDGTFADLLPLPQAWDRVTDLGVSPDGAALSFVAPGPGSARELYVLDRRTLAYRQLSALGYASLLRPAWRPGGGEIAFLAAQSPDMAPAIYSAALNEQGQRLLWAAQGAALRDLAWSADGALLFFSAGEIYALDVAGGTVSPPLTAVSGFGPDYGLAHSPTDAALYYLKPFRDLQTGAAGGRPHRISTADLSAAPVEQKVGDGFMERLVFSGDGAFLALASATDVWLRELAFNTSVQVVSGAGQPPQPALSPDGQQAAYIDLDAAGVPQVFVVDRLGGAPRQLTAHMYGTVSDLVWADG